MKIALTGAHGTGKTTLAASIHQALPDSLRAAVCREVPRIIIDAVGQEDFFRRINNTRLRQCIIFLFQIMEDHFNSMSNDVVISDRSIIDHLAYTLCLFPDFAKEPEYLPIENAIARWMSTYDLVFKVPIEFPVRDDGVREGDIEFQQSIDSKIDELYARFHIETKLISGTVEERTRFVMATLLPLMRRNKAV